MKRKLLFLLCLLYLLPALPAQYLPLVEENKYWIIQRYAGSEDGAISSAHLLTIRGDIKINNVLYRKVFKHELSGKHSCPTPPCFVIDLPYKPGPGELYQYIREDLNTKEVFHFPIYGQWCEQEEYKIFDFGLQPMEAIDSCTTIALHSQFKDSILVDSISTTFLYGKERKTFHTNGLVPLIGLQWVDRISYAEGMGYENFGLFHRNGDLEELVDFCEGSWADCNIISALSPSPRPMEINIYPNPVQDVLVLDTPQKIQHYQLFDLNGKKIREGQEYKLELQDLTPGIYYLKLLLADGQTLSKKIIKA